MDALQKVLPPKLVTPLTLEDFVEY